MNCGVTSNQYDKVMGTFRELLDLGADGLWLSFDDKGPGDDPVALTKQVLELGRERQISGQRIAITPPKGSYQRIVTEFNRKIMAVPGMEQALWFWTGVPSTLALEDARSIGIKVRPSWWHNWPRLDTPQILQRRAAPVAGLERAGLRHARRGRGFCRGRDALGRECVRPALHCTRHQLVGMEPAGARLERAAPAAVLDCVRRRTRSRRR